MAINKDEIIKSAEKIKGLMEVGVIPDPLALLPDDITPKQFINCRQYDIKLCQDATSKVMEEALKQMQTKGE